MMDIKNFVTLLIFIALLFNGCGKEEEKNKAEIALAIDLPVSVKNNFSIAPSFFVGLIHYIRPAG